MEKTHEIDEPPQLKASSSVQPRNPPLNKYALACALLASTNSILLGYGKIPITFLLPFPRSAFAVCVQSKRLKSSGLFIPIFDNQDL